MKRARALGVAGRAQVARGADISPRLSATPWRAAAVLVWLGSVRSQALDVRECHVDRCPHRGDVARSLSQHVPALQGSHQPGGEMVDRGVGREPAAVLEPLQHVCQESLPLGEQSLQGLTRERVVIGDLGGQ